MNISDIIDYIEGRDSSKSEQIASWVKESDDNRSEYFRLKELSALRVCEELKSPHALDSAVDMVHERIKVRRISNRYRRQSIFAWSVSACFALLVRMISFVRYLPAGRGDVVLANYTEPVSFYSLPDGTKAFLKKGSSISYSRSFDKKNRKVSLDGQAYFDVSRSDKNSFIVHTPQVDVKVLGTSFNVISMEGETEVVLERGKVGLCRKSGSLMAELVPGNRALVDSKGNVVMSSVQTSDYTKWRYYYKVYDSCAFDDFVSMMESRFDVRFIYDPSKFKDVYFRLAISENDTLDDMLEMMQYIARVDYERNGRNIYVILK